jgi:hypothetical protein
MASSGRKEALNNPKLWSRWSHWQSLTSVLRPGTWRNLPGIDQKHLDAGSFQLLEECYSVDPGRLDGHGRDPASFQPLDQGIQSVGESAEAAHKGLAWLYEPRRHSDVMFLGSAINTARMRMDYFHPLFPAPDGYLSPGPAFGRITAQTIFSAG